MNRRLRRKAKRVYNYHNLGVGIFPEGEEKTPYGSGERYNFDRMAMFVSSYDFTDRAVVDLGCNSGWFCLQPSCSGHAPRSASTTRAPGRWVRRSISHGSLNSA